MFQYLFVVFTILNLFSKSHKNLVVRVSIPLRGLHNLKQNKLSSCSITLALFQYLFVVFTILNIEAPECILPLVIRVSIPLRGLHNLKLQESNKQNKKLNQVSIPLRGLHNLKLKIKKRKEVKKKFQYLFVVFTILNIWTKLSWKLRLRVSIPLRGLHNLKQNKLSSCSITLALFQYLFVVFTILNWTGAETDPTVVLFQYLFVVFTILNSQQKK